MVALKTKEIWLSAFTTFFVYAVFCGITYFIPFLENIYALPIALVGAYGVINQYGLKMVGGPIGGYLADKTFKSTSRYFSFCFKLIIIANIIMILLAKSKISIIVGFIFVIVFSI